MMRVGVNRWHTEFLAAAPLPAEQIELWNAGLRGLDTGAVDLSGDDEWVFIRSLDLTSRWSVDADASAALRACQESFASSVRNALRDAAPNTVVRYRDRREALTDMLYRAAAGDLRRAFAWRRMGLLPASSADTTAGDAVERAVLALVAMPHYIWPALARFLAAESATGAWTALMHCLDARHWDALLLACPQTRALQEEASRVLPRAQHSSSTSTAGPLTQSLCDWMSAHPWAARERRALLAVLLAGMHDGPATSAMTRSDCRCRLDLAANLIARHVGPAAERLAKPRKRADAPSPAERTRDESSSAPPIPDRVNRADGAREDLPEAPPLPVDEALVVTAWAGLAFLINIVPRCALVDRVHAASAIGDEHCLQRLLRQIAVAHFNVPADDPAVRAWCGGWEPREDDEARADGVDAFAAEGASMLRDALRACLPELSDASDLPLVELVCKRPGRIRFEPGWIEIHMDPEQADVRLRRAALDFDPGFVPWLGCVVRFRYA